MHIAILTGGISTERAVALRSGENMKHWCEVAGHRVSMYDLPDQIDAFLQAYKNYDFVIPVLHGRYGEDGIISGMCESIGIKIAGCPSSVHALCIDKFHTNCVVEKIGVKIPKSWINGIPIPPKLLPTNEKIHILEKALIVKPNRGGSSLATTKAKTAEELSNGVKSIDLVIQSLTEERVRLLEKNEKSDFARTFPALTDFPLIQECIEGREFTVGVYFQDDSYHALPIIEIKTLKNAFFDYEEKYESDGSNEVFMEGEEDIQKTLREQSENICRYIGTKGVVRIDWRYDGKDIYFLEVNTIPGFTSGSLVPKMWKKALKSETDFIKMLTP